MSDDFCVSRFTYPASPTYSQITAETFRLNSVPARDNSGDHEIGDQQFHSECILLASSASCSLGQLFQDRMFSLLQIELPIPLPFPHADTILSPFASPTSGDAHDLEPRVN